MREPRQNWLDLFSAFRIAIDPKKMMLGFVGVLLSLAIFFALLYAFKSAFPQGVAVVSGYLLEPKEGYPALHDAIRNHLGAGKLGLKEIGFLLVTGVLMLLVWSYFGGAILRSSAVEFCKDDRIDLREGTTFARRKLSSFFWAPVIPFLGILFFLLCIYLGGLVGRIDYVGPVVVGIFFFLALLAGFLIMLITIGASVGSVLMWPTVAVEGTDAFDAISRAFSYVYGRPWRFIWYCLVSLAYGAVCVAFVAIFASLMLRVVIGTGTAGMGSNFAPIKSFLVEHTYDPKAGFSGNFCAVLMMAGVIAVCGLVAGFCVSMRLTLHTIVYCLLRKDVDGTDMSEVYVEEEEEQELLQGEEKQPTEAEAGKPPAETQEGSTGA